MIMAFDKNNNTHVSDEVKKCLQEKYKENARCKHDGHDTNMKNVQIDNTSTEEKKSKKKITIEVDEDDPCLARDGGKSGKTLLGPGDDPRLYRDHCSDSLASVNTQRQCRRLSLKRPISLLCHRKVDDDGYCSGDGCVREESSACAWFKQVFTSICPKEWIRRWDVLRSEGKFSWHKYNTQGEFPGDKYGV